MTNRPENMQPKTDRPNFCRHSERPEACPVCTTCAAEGCHDRASALLQSPVQEAPIPVCPKHQNSGIFVVRTEFVEKKS